MGFTNPNSNLETPIAGKKTVALGYNATVDKKRRQAPKSKVTAEKVVLGKADRSKLQATAQEQQRNHSLMAWMIRQHLDYVSSFKIQFKFDDEKVQPLVDALKKVFRMHAKPENFDVARRLGREEGFRFFEAEKTVCGDAAMVKVGAPYYSLQMIESDLIAFPKIGKKIPSSNNQSKKYNTIPVNVRDSVDEVDGVVLNRVGAIDKFCICNRGFDGKQVSFDHLEKWNNVIFDCYYTRFSSQTRGVSPLSTALNTIQDLYEGFEWALLQHKVQSLFGIALMRDYNGTEEKTDLNQSGLVGGAAVEAETTGDTSPEAAASTITTTLKDITPKETFIIDMDQKGKVETIESKSPSGEYINACGLTIQISLLALDLPLSTFDSRKSSFSAMIADRNLYEKSCKTKIEKNKWCRQEYSNFVVDSFWYDKKFQLAKVAASCGVTDIEVVKEMVEWISSGFPWLQKLQEINGDCKAIAGGLDNAIDATRRRGGDVFENIRKNAMVLKAAKDAGVPIVYGDSGQRTAEEIEQAVAAAMDKRESEKANENEE